MRRLPDNESALSPEAEPKGDGTSRLNLTLSRILAVGLVAAVVLLVTGAALALAGRGPSVSSATVLTDMPRALAALEPGGFLQLGLLVLLATPVARVIALAVGFAKRRSWGFCGMSLFVLAILGLSVYLGLRG